MILYIKKAQKGTILAPTGLSVDNQRELDKQLNWVGGMIQSPMYKKRLLREGWSDPRADWEIKDRAANLDKTGIAYDTDEQMGENMAEGTRGWYNPPSTGHNIPSSIPHPTFNDLQTYLVETPGTIHFGEDNEFYNERPIGVHEGSHGSTEGRTSGSKLRAYGNYNEPYLGSGTEIKSRVDELRYMAEELGIYDAKTEEFTQNHLNALYKYMDARDSYESYKKNTGFEGSMTDEQFRNHPGSKDAMEELDKYRQFNYLDWKIPENEFKWDLRTPLNELQQGVEKEDSNFSEQLMYLMNTIAQNKSSTQAEQYT